MNGTADLISNHNDRQKLSELECTKRWLSVYNRINQTSYGSLRANYFQNEVDVYAYRDREAGRPLRLQITRADLGSIAATIKRKASLYSPEQKADLLLLLDFQGKTTADDILVWQQQYLQLLSESGFWEIWLVGANSLVVNLWPGEI